MRREITLLLVTAMFASTGCALIGETPARVGGRSTLDDAAHAAKPDSSGKHKRLDTGWTLPPSGGTSVEVSPGYDEGGPGYSDGGRDRASGLQRVMVGVSAGGGTIGGTRYDGFGEFGLDVALVPEERWRIDLIGAVSPIEFADASIAGQSFDDEFDLNLDVTARYSLTPSHTFMSAGPLLGIRIGTLFWDYARPIPVMQDGRLRQIENDHINHFSVYAGLACDVARFRHMQLGAGLFAGARFYSWTSYEGFSNTLFPSAGFVQMRADLLFH